MDNANRSDSNILNIAAREFAAFFASPAAYIFLGAFLVVSLFVFFWVETFFSRNIADARPLFQWIPVLLIFLVAALTMRAWSEERRAGTLELLFTLPVSSPQLVLGKFLGSFALVAVALALTLPLPLTVSLLGPLDWGPVLGAYLASLLLGGAYIAIGLFISARTDNQIVALIGAVAACGLLYLLGSDTVAGLFGTQAAEVLKLIGSGSRFESITRGVIDLRDLYYYLSLMGIFLALNVYTLERLRWATDRADRHHHRAWGWVLGLFIANFAAGNLWLQPLGGLRLDLTQGQVYTISDATRTYLGQLREPLLIRGYFSAQTHPELAPLVPQLRDLLKEYEVAGQGLIRVEFVDPLESPELEQEAGEKYGIKPVAFQTASKYQASVVNSYFDILVQYGDQYEKLGFRDLIEVKVRPDGELEVRLRNPEYDLTRTIKKALYAYQAGGDLFAGLPQPVVFKGFVSAPSRLPQPLDTLAEDLKALTDELAGRSGGKLQVEIADPDANGGQLAHEILEKYGFQPLAVDLLDPNSFYFYMVMESGDQTVPVPLPEGLNKEGLNTALEAALKRFSPGILRTIALATPAAEPMALAMGMGMAQSDYGFLEEKLHENARVIKADLETGQVPPDTDLLLVVGPRNLSAKAVFAIDQYLMQGGALVLATNGFDIQLGQGAISATQAPSGLEEWLQAQGLEVREALVLDPQNTPFPIPVERRIGGFTVQEVQALAYPYFPDVRGDQLDPASGITSSLGQLTLNWVAPLAIDESKNQGRTLTRLIRSSDESWTSASPQIQPDFQRYPQTGFAPGQDQRSEVLAVAVEGRFSSFFKGKPSPLLQPKEGQASGQAAGENSDPMEAGAKEPEETQTRVSGVVETSPPSARILLIGSSTFVSDTALDLAAQATGTRYLKPIELMENTVDWMLEDRGLLNLRGRGQYSRMLAPLDREAQMFWEYLNYGLALGGLALVYVLDRRARARRRARQEAILALPVTPEGGTAS
jgi:ABC-2 type transport system permease protein